MGTWSGHKAKFVRRFANLKEVRDQAVQSFGEAVKEGTFPDPEAESYSMDKGEWARFMENESNECKWS
jgi:3-methyl-2-oxobutanoate hydroxymethyltransferase